MHIFILASQQPKEAGSVLNHLLYYI